MSYEPDQPIRIEMVRHAMDAREQQRRGRRESLHAWPERRDVDGIVHQLVIAHEASEDLRIRHAPVHVDDVLLQPIAPLDIRRLIVHEIAIHLTGRVVAEIGEHGKDPVARVCRE